MIYSVEGRAFENFLTRRGVASLAKFTGLTVGAKEHAKELAIAQLKKRTAEIIQQRRTCSQLAKWHQLAKGNSKAIASTYVYKPNFAFNASRAAIVHHWGGGGGGSHYHSAGTKLFNKGFRLRGVVMRHSHQAALRNGKAGQQRCDNRKGGAGGHGGRQARGPAGGRC